MNSRKHEEAKELKNLKTEDENKTLIIKNTLENVSQATTFLHKNQGMDKQKYIKAILSEETSCIKPKKSFKSNRNYQNSSYNEPVKPCNGLEVLHNDKVIDRSIQQRCSLRKGVLRNFVKFTGKHLCQSLFLNKVSGLRPATLLKKRLWHRCFPVNFVKFLRTPFSIEHI